MSLYLFNDDVSEFTFIQPTALNPKPWTSIDSISAAPVTTRYSIIKTTPSKSFLIIYPLLLYSVPCEDTVPLIPRSTYSCADLLENCNRFPAYQDDKFHHSLKPVRSHSPWLDLFATHYVWYNKPSLKVRSHSASLLICLQTSWVHG